MRDNSLDPNSPNQSNQGSDPTNPKESNQPSDGKEEAADSGQQTAEEKGDPNEGQAGDTDSDSGNNEGSPQDGQPDKGNSGSEGTEGGGSEPQSGEQGSGGGETDQQQPGNPQDGDPGGQGSPEMGGSGGGTGVSKETKPDDPNLKYANQITDMVLEYLEDQLKERPSEDLLKKLGWNEDQLRQFYEKWKKMSEESKQPQMEEGKNAWEEALKSIGLLRPNRNQTLQGGHTKTQDDQRVTEGVRRNAPPSLLERFRNYNDNVGK